MGRIRELAEAGLSPLRFAGRALYGRFTASRQRWALGFLSSSLAHVVLLIVLAVIFIAPQFSDSGAQQLDLTLNWNETSSGEDYALAGQFGGELSFGGAARSDSTLAPPAIRIDTRSMKLKVYAAADRKSLDPPSGGLLTPVRRIPGPMRRRDPLDAGPQGLLQSADSPEDAFGHLARGIRDELSQGDLILLWVFDESLSLRSDRGRLAGELERFVEEVQQFNDGSYGTLLQILVGFGAASHEVVERTGRGQRIPSALRRKLPVDMTGAEHVCSAVATAVNSQRDEKWRRVMVVVWTDESGDDLQLLEPTIQLCLRRHVPVSVVGPVAVLGSERGFARYVHPQVGPVMLPVDRGPDSALPERIDIPLWFRPVDLELPAEQQALNLPRWQGGISGQGLLSGLPPFSLARLAYMTGGQFVVIDRPEEAAPFSLDAMRAYTPDYAMSIAEHERDQRGDDLIDGLHRAAEMLPPGSRLILPWRYPSGGGWGRYTAVPPSVFRVQLPGVLAGKLAQLRREQKAVEEALRVLQAPHVLAAYEQHPSKRWRAWYELARGRLLAYSLRMSQFWGALLSLRKNGVERETNRVVFDGRTAVEGDSAVEERLEEARRWLARCVENNEGTPWGWAAKTDLASPFGVVVHEFQDPVLRVKPPSGGGGGRSSGAPRFPPL